jgi:hypothetical protein
MTLKDDVRRDLAVVAEQIANARAALTRNELVDLTGIPDKVRSVSGAITDLVPDEAAEMRPLLIALLSEFKEFSDDVRNRIAAIQENKEPDGRRASSGRSAP